MPTLTDKDRALLDIESLSWRWAGRKEAAVLERTGMSMTAAYQRLLHLIDTPEAMQHDPITCRRLRDRRDSRRVRSA